MTAGVRVIADLSRMLRDCLEKFLRAKPKQRKDKP